jgi:hypothetical protein
MRKHKDKRCPSCGASFSERKEIYIPSKELPEEISTSSDNFFRDYAIFQISGYASILGLPIIFVFEGSFILWALFIISVITFLIYLNKFTENG